MEIIFTFFQDFRLIFRPLSFDSLDGRAKWNFYTKTLKQKLHLGMLNSRKSDFLGVEKEKI